MRDLFVALFPLTTSKPQSSEPKDSYDWSVVVGSPVGSSQGERIRWHVVPQPEEGAQTIWNLERDVIEDKKPLAMFLVAGIINEEFLERTLRDMPMNPWNKDDWNTCFWARDALKALEDDNISLGEANIDWDALVKFAPEYASRKGERAADASVPVWSYLDGKELVE
ncbi:hypothetical protein K470DRAFT_278073 [Piedraia hortae CBS 480.64]|uniref:Uncharacterized protein n=1 Tax=Piedraia hortae CBS 480.64 TaxID=1314780 RepID=A0A6A7BV85_9PEZI|nr:hypothetical protein K470DRAFT_278073 [Piedraia hortae CBS 480.64]